MRAYLQREVVEAAADSIANPYYEPTGANGAYVRVYLRCITENLITEHQLFDAFLRSAQPQQRMEDWCRLWQEDIVPAARNAGLGFSEEELAELTDASRQNRAVRHSDGYRNAYHPHYRIVEWSIFETEIKPYLLDTVPDSVRCDRTEFRFGTDAEPRLEISRKTAPGSLTGTGGSRFFLFLMIKK